MLHSSLWSYTYHKVSTQRQNHLVSLWYRWFPFRKRADKTRLQGCELAHWQWPELYEYEPKQWDIIVSNPPFTKKREIFEHSISFGKPFALIMTTTWLKDSAHKQLFRDVDQQLLMFDRRIEFTDKKITFSCSYFCRDIMPKQIIMEHLKKFWCFFNPFLILLPTL